MKPSFTDASVCVIQKRKQYRLQTQRKNAEGEKTINFFKEVFARTGRSKKGESNLINQPD
jgi:hypothetical protein